jgi:hypothetical protein
LLAPVELALAVGREECALKRLLHIVLGALILAGCSGDFVALGQLAPPVPASFAVFAEFARDHNKLMKNGLNRRVYNVVEAQSGTDIQLASDGSITLQPGTYRLSGFSLVTMQATFAPPQPQNNSNYPGYCLVYPVAFESDIPNLLPNAIVIGSPQTAMDTSPSLFEAVYTVTETTTIAVGHQSGEDLHDEVYLSVYEVEGIPSDYHVFSRISITRL